MTKRLAAFGALLTVVGCGSDASDVPLTTVRDSAGIRIIENRLPAGVAPVYARLGEPDLEIGVVEGDPAHQLSSVEDVVSLPDGSVVLAEGDAQEVRVFDGAGAHVRTLGRQGEGPGEFARLENVAGLAADTVWLWDSRTQRVTWLRLDGSVVGDFRLDDVGISGRMTRLGDGTFLGSATEVTGNNAGGSLALDGSIMRESIVVLRIDAGGDVIDTVAVMPGPETSVSEGGTSASGLRLITLRSPPFPVTSLAAGAGDRIYAGPNDRYRIDARNLSGDLLLVVLAPDLDRELEASEIEGLMNARMERCSDTPCEESVRRWFDIFEPPELRPAFSALEVDALDHLWVAEWEPEGTPVSGWHVFSPDGELLGRVAIPPGLEVHEIGEDFVLGVVTDELDVPFVRRYPLTRLR